MKPRLTIAASALALALSAPGYASDSSVEVLQFGDSNSASVEQTNSPVAVARISQVGDQNGSARLDLPTILQANAPASTALIDQLGDLNGASIDQRNTSSLASVNQAGDSNAARVSQSGGIGNAGLVYQGGAGCLTAFGCKEDETFALDAADGNVASIDQVSGSRNTALILQGGIVHSGAIQQLAGDDNFARLIQTGISHRARIQQGGFVCPLGGSCVETRSDRSTVLAFQTGSDNELDVIQSGSDNFVSVFQNGAGVIGGNTALIDQMGNNLRASVTQIGSLNTTRIVQR